jgi:hypothetical protein
MKNKKLPMFILGALLLGAGGSIAAQSFAQTPAPVQPTAIVSNQADQTIDQKDAQGNDIETNDDTKASIGSEKESANDNDSDAKSEQNEKDSGGVEVESANN